MAAQEDIKEFDIIFCGGGTAACVAAGRLAKGNPDLSILLIEGGKNNLNEPSVVNPAMYLTNLVPEAQNALFYKGVASKHLNGREPVVPSGGMLGGGSSINFMMYTRAQGCDYDSWDTEGWDFQSLLPLFKKFETFHVNDPAIDYKTRGNTGPINVSQGTYYRPYIQDEILAAAESIGEPQIDDLADFKSCGGFAPKWARYVGPDGKRQDAAHRYIHHQNLPNVHLQVESKVVRVLFDENKRAVGVEYEPTTSFQPIIALSKKPSSQVKARKMVVISSGALGSPSILERSGVGNANLLSKLDIDVVSNLSGVGEEYQDHQLSTIPYKTSLKPEDTLDALLSGRMDFLQAVKDKEPIIGWNAIDVAGKVRPSDQEIQAMGSEIQSLWDRDYKEKTNRPLVLMIVDSAYIGDHKILNGEPAQYICIGNMTTYPYSRGSIHIASKSVHEPAAFDPGFFSHPADVEIQMWAYKKQRELVRRTNFYRGELAIGHPRFHEGSKATLYDGPAAGGSLDGLEARAAIPPIEYDEDDDRAIETWLRDNITTTWHSLGTCKMAPAEKGGVVDKDLNVHGTEALKVADLSICPENVGANTNNTALMIGEKAAEIIAKELDLKA